MVSEFALSIQLGNDPGLIEKEDSMKTAFEKFREENIPASVKVSGNEFRLICRTLAIKVEIERPGYEIVRPGCLYRVSPDGDVVLKYVANEMVNGAVRVVYTPYLEGTNQSRGIDCKVSNVFTILHNRLRCGFAPVITILLPEPVVLLPIPSWVGVVSDHPLTGRCSSWMFESEARCALDSFNKEALSIFSKR